MKIRLAAFGSEQMIEQVTRFAAHFEGIEFIPYIYHKIEESPQLVQRATNVDVLLFTGPLPYMHSKKAIQEKKIPAVFIPVDEYMISLVLFKAIHQLNCTQFSMDITDAVNMEDVLDELSLDMKDVYIQNLSHYYDLEGRLNDKEVVQFHEKLWLDGKIQMAITSISNVYAELKRKEIPVIRMIHPKKTIMDTLRRAIMFGELELSKKAQIAVGIVSIHQYQALLTDKGSYLAEHSSLVLHQLLLDFSAEINASIQKVGKEEFIIYSTKGPFEMITNQYRFLPILTKIKKLLNIKVNIGFGFGLTTKEAENNAQLALKYSADNRDKYCAYLVNADKRLLGPLTSHSVEGVHDHGSTSSDYLLFISQKSGINIQNARKIVEFHRMTSYKPFSATQLAEYMQISRRSAERFIKNMVTAELARVIGEEQLTPRGRPTALYQLNDLEKEHA
ncbi:hypothetical protein [Bacillus horti]|uniref:Transcriptional regulator n=1 Tax=Caldalkalibacillus horti TaxID=77523 RepID=A0ABT9VV69_9BACI|nr:hypothetical protein [Bacillus horti]MDQ0164881.1 hypothetical protein [Bacillus horti]